MSTETRIIVRKPQGFRSIYPTILLLADCLVVPAMASMSVLKKERLGLPPTYHTIMSRLVPCELTVYSQPIRLSRATSLCSRLHSGPVVSCMMSITQETISPVTQRQSMDGVGGVVEVTLVHPHPHLRYLLLVVSGRFSSCNIMNQLL